MIIAKFCVRDQTLHAEIAQFSMAFSSRQFFFRAVVQKKLENVKKFDFGNLRTFNYRAGAL